jgi:hypothetical protein
MFIGIRNAKARIPNKIEYRLLDVEKAAIMNPAAAKNAAITDRKARVLRVIFSHL